MPPYTHILRTHAQAQTKACGTHSLRSIAMLHASFILVPLILLTQDELIHQITNETRIGSARPSAPAPAAVATPTPVSPITPTPFHPPITIDPKQNKTNTPPPSSSLSYPLSINLSSNIYTLTNLFPPSPHPLQINPLPPFLPSPLSLTYTTHPPSLPFPSLPLTSSSPSYTPPPRAFTARPASECALSSPKTNRAHTAVPFDPAQTCVSARHSIA